MIPGNPRKTPDEFDFDLSKLDITHEKFVMIAQKSLSILEDVITDASKDGQQAPPAMIVPHVEFGDDDVSSDIIIAVVPIEGGFETTEQKHKSIASIGAMFRKKRTIPFAAFIACEAWASTSKTPTPDVMPSEDPNRKEVAMVSGFSLKRDECIMICKEIVRGENGAVSFKNERIETDKRMAMPIIDYFWRGYFNKHDGQFKKFQ